MPVKNHSLVFILPFFLVAGLLHAQVPRPYSATVEQQVDSILAKLTLGQKIDLIGGEDGMFIRVEPAAGFPKLKMSGDPIGVVTWGPSTAYARGIALAASWDPQLANRVGVALGRDDRARGVHILLGPGVNIYRAPMDGRNFEYFGEDPYLAAFDVVDTGARAGAEVAELYVGDPSARIKRPKKELKGFQRSGSILISSSTLALRSISEPCGTGTALARDGASI